MGRELAEIAHEDGIMTAAFKSRIPVFCPDLVGTELSIGIARARFEKKSQIYVRYDAGHDGYDANRTENAKFRHHNARQHMQPEYGQYGRDIVLYNADDTARP